MKKLVLLTVLVASIAVLSLAVAAPAAAQPTHADCTRVGVITGGDILVDVSENRNDGLVPGNIQCSWLRTYPEGAGTPLSGARAIPDYTSLIGIDVWTASRSGARADFDVYDPPVRVCFDASEYGLDASSAVGPEESAAGQSGPTIMFSDARHFNTLKRSNDGYFGGSRNFVQLDVVVEDGFICGDISYPGLLNLVPGLPPRDASDPTHPNTENVPDRCLVPGASDCFD